MAARNAGDTPNAKYVMAMMTRIGVPRMATPTGRTTPREYDPP